MGAKVLEIINSKAFTFLADFLFNFALQTKIPYNNMKKTIMIAALALLGSSTLLMNGCKKDDTTAPVVTVNDGSSRTVILNNPISDPGAKSDDGSSVTSNWSSTNPDFTTAGTYTVTYTATDGAGNTGTAVLTVNVNIDRSTYIWNGYSALDSAASTGYFTWSGSITAGAGSTIIISNFSGTLQNCIATVSGANLTIASQTVGAYTIVGSGTMNNKGDKINLAYNDGTENHIAVLSKQ
jgi:hypothetical protein